MKEKIFFTHNKQNIYSQASEWYKYLPRIIIYYFVLRLYDLKKPLLKVSKLEAEFSYIYRNITRGSKCFDGSWSIALLYQFLGLIDIEHLTFAHVWDG